MSYFAQPSDLNARYDPANITLFSDLAGDGNSTTINARIALALAIADQWVWGQLRPTVYQNCLGPSSAPTIVDAAGNVPLLLTNCAVMYAGWYLLTARGTRDYDKDGKPMNHLYADYQEAKQIMRQIADKQLALDVPGVNL